MKLHTRGSLNLRGRGKIHRLINKLLDYVWLKDHYTNRIVVYLITCLICLLHHCKGTAPARSASRSPASRLGTRQIGAIKLAHAQSLRRLLDVVVRRSRVLDEHLRFHLQHWQPSPSLTATSVVTSISGSHGP